jgi:RNA polymerase sigma-70 factor (ECF subfamily)
VDDADVDLAARALHDAHAAALLAWARRRTADPGEAEEVVQETLVRAWRKQHQFDPARGSERAWLFGIARNVAADRGRRESRRLRLVPTVRSHDEPVDPMPDLDRVVEQSLVRDALLALSSEHRAVLVEAYFRGCTVREVAERLAVPEGTVKSRLFYGLRSLRAELEARGVLP